MKLEIKDNQIFVDGKYDGFFSPSDKVVAELARRVNGWDEIIAALRGMLSPPENGGEVLEKIKVAREALRKAGVE